MAMCHCNRVKGGCCDDVQRLRVQLRHAIDLLDDIMETAAHSAERYVTDQYLAANIEPEMGHLRRTAKEPQT